MELDENLKVKSEGRFGGLEKMLIRWKNQMGILAIQM